MRRVSLMIVAFVKWVLLKTHITLLCPRSMNFSPCTEICVKPVSGPQIGSILLIMGVS